MSRTPKLNDLQLVLLSHAAKTDAGNLNPLPATIDPEAAHKEARALLRRGFLTEFDTTSPAACWRSEDHVHFGLIITESGKAAIALGEADAAETSSEPGSSDEVAPTGQKPTAENSPRSNSKISNVLALLRRPEGATLAALIEATGWQQHTVRAAMTGLRKRGFALHRRKECDATVWFIAEAGE